MKTEKLLRKFWGMTKECCSGFGSEIVPKLPRGQVIGLIWDGGAGVVGKMKYKGICGSQGYQVECCVHESRAWGKRWPGLVVWGSISKDQWKLNQNDVGLWGWQHLLGRSHMQVTFFNKTLWMEVMTRTWLLPQTHREGGGEICESLWFKRFFLFC